MLKLGQCIYRFKFDPYAEIPEFIKQTFKVVDIKLADPLQGKFSEDRYKFKCLEDPNAMYKDGSFVYESSIKFASPKGGGGLFFVTLEDDDIYQASLLIRQYLQDRVAEMQRKFESAQSTLVVFDSITS